VTDVDRPAPVGTSTNTRTGAIRPVQPGDVPAVVAMAHELAAYERAPEQCTLTADQLAGALFGDRPALFGHVAVSPSGEPVGFALWFLNYSTWTGTHGIYLEDLYVDEAHRGRGVGTTLLRRLARLAVERGCARLEWSALDSNAAAIAFYEKLGAEALPQRTVSRLTDESLARLAAGR